MHGQCLPLKKYKRKPNKISSGERKASDSVCASRGWGRGRQAAASRAGPCTQRPDRARASGPAQWNVLEKAPEEVAVGADLPPPPTPASGIP